MGRSRALDRFAPDRRVGQLVVVEHDVGVVGADMLATSCTYGVSMVGRTSVGFEVLGLVDEVDGEGAHGRLSRRADERGDRAGVQPAGEQHTFGHVGDELAGDDVLEQSAHVRDGASLVVGVRSTPAASSVRSRSRVRRR